MYVPENTLKLQTLAVYFYKDHALAFPDPKNTYKPQNRYYYRNWIDLMVSSSQCTYSAYRKDTALPLIL